MWSNSRDIRAYIPISLSDAATQKIMRPDGKQMVTRQARFPSTSIRVPAISFGASNLNISELYQIPVDTEHASTHLIKEIDVFIIDKALVYSGAGLVICGNYFFTDFLHHAQMDRLPGWTSRCGFCVDGNFIFPACSPQIELEDAFHLLAGNVNNYFHWMIDVIGRFNFDLYEEHSIHRYPYLLVPQLDLNYKKQSFDLLHRKHQPVIQCNDNTVISVDKLVVLPDLSGSGFSPHPALLRPFVEMRSSVQADTAAISKLIYISRADSKQRRLINEGEVMEAVRAVNFEIMTLSNLTIVEQIQVFSKASHIIAPHGAGLVNILLCNPGASLLELHMDSYVQWSFRRLAGSIGMNYGCLIGKTTQPWEKNEWPHCRNWTIDVDALRAVITADDFLLA